MPAETTTRERETMTTETTYDTWEMWVGDQSASEFLSYCDPSRPISDEVSEYVDAVIAGDVFGPVELGDEFDREYVINALLDRIRETVVGQTVTHNVLGQGEVIDVDDLEVVVKFDIDERRFPRSSIVDGRIVMTHREA